jgi:hypothetical protein
MSEPPAPSPQEAGRNLARAVREASKRGELTRLADVWPGTEEEYLALEHQDESCDLADIASIRDGGDLLLYSDVYMTGRYARTAALAVSGDVHRLIAETVRSDSVTYPRPTPVETFAMAPFSLPSEAITSAVERLAADTRYEDIRSVRASDGSLFLFSASFLDPVHARSLAEWTAVTQFENP